MEPVEPEKDALSAVEAVQDDAKQVEREPVELEGEPVELEVEGEPVELEGEGGPIKVDYLVWG